MFLHTLTLSIRALRQDALRTALMIAAVGLGIGAAMTSATVFRAMAANPMAHKDGRLFTVQMNNWEPGSPYVQPGEPPMQLTYQDSVALWRAHRAQRQALIYANDLPIEGVDGKLPPTLIHARFTTSDFFPMFEVPMRFGSGWDASTDGNGGDELVLSRALNDRIFGGANSVGRQLRAGGETFTVVGVADDWHPQPRFYDFDFSGQQPDDDVFLPFRFGIAHQIRGNNNDCWPSFSGGFDGFLRSECVWINLWVEVASTADAAAYRAFVDDYATAQKARGRFRQPLDDRLTPVATWLDARGALRSDVRVQTLLSFAFLMVCLINTVGLLLARFLSRSREVSVHRALGATRGQIFLRYLAEAGVIGLGGAALGLALTFGGTGLMRLLDPSLARIAQLDADMIAATVLLALAASLGAGAIPAWRVCRLVPATFLKAD